MVTVVGFKGRGTANLLVDKLELQPYRHLLDTLLKSSTTAASNVTATPAAAAPPPQAESPVVPAAANVSAVPVVDEMKD